MSCEIVVEDFVGGDAHIAPRQTLFLDRRAGVAYYSSIDLKKGWAHGAGHSYPRGAEILPRAAGAAAGAAGHRPRCRTGGVHHHRRAQRLRTFDLADVPYPRDPEASRLRDLKRAVTEECLRGSAG